MAMVNAVEKTAPSIATIATTIHALTVDCNNLLEEMFSSLDGSGGTIKQMDEDSCPVGVVPMLFDAVKRLEHLQNRIHTLRQIIG